MLWDNIRFERWRFVVLCFASIVDIRSDHEDSSLVKELTVVLPLAYVLLWLLAVIGEAYIDFGEGD
jgi:hypothetical protein